MSLEEFARQDKDFLAQPWYKSFSIEMQSSLAFFEKTQEWADLIKCLDGIIRLFKKYKNIPLIPEKLVLAKRLAQCLNLSLPSGVHLKAIETYIAVFNHIKDRFARDVNVFSLGIFTFFPYASIQLKPQLVKMFEDFFMPVGKAIIPISSAFVMSLLSGLEEEEGTTCYSKCLAMIDTLRKTIDDDDLFFRVIWDNILFCKSVRVPGFKYLMTVCKRNEEIETICKNRMLATHAIIVSLRDDIQSQRICLDLLLYFKGIFKRDEPIVTGMILLFLKEDLSINRRIYQYLFDKENLHVDTLIASFVKLLEIEPKTSMIINAFKRDENVYLTIFESLMLNILRFIDKFDDKVVIVEILKTFPREFWKGLSHEFVSNLNVDFVIKWLKRVEVFDDSTLEVMYQFALDSILASSPKTKDFLVFLDYLVSGSVLKTEPLVKVYEKCEKIYIMFTRNFFKAEVKEYFKSMVNIMIKIHSNVEIEHKYFQQSLVDTSHNEDIHLSLFCIRSLAGMKNIPDDVLKSLNVTTWNLLKKNNEEYFYEVTRLLVEFYKLNKQISDNFMSEELTGESTRIDAHKRFSLLWKLLNELNILRVFDHGLLLMIDSLKSEHAFQCLIAKTWLLNSMSNIKHILDTLLFLLIDAQHKNKSTIFDERRSKYIMKLLISMVQVDPEMFIKNCTFGDLSGDLMNEYQRFFVKDLQHGLFHMPSHQFSIPVKNYLDLLVSVAVKMLECDNQDELNSDIKSNCISFLKTILIHENYNLVNVILHHLKSSIQQKDYVFQIELLDILNILMKSNQIDLKSLSETVNYGIKESDQETLNYWIKYMSHFLSYFKDEALYAFVKDVVTNLTKNFNNPSIIGMCNVYIYVLKEMEKELHSAPPPSTSFSLIGLFVQEKPKESWIKKTKAYLFSNIINDIIYQMIIKDYKNSSQFLLMIPRNELIKSFVNIWYKINPEITNSFEIKLNVKNIQDPLLNLIKNMNLNLEEFLRVTDLLHVGINLVSLYIDRYDLPSYSSSYIVINDDILCLGMSLKLLYKFIQKDPANKLKFKSTTNKLIEHSIVRATKQCMEKQKIINQNSLIEEDSHLDLSSQIFKLISEIGADIIVDYNAINVTNLFAILKIYNFENLTRMRSILNFLRYFKNVKREVLDIFYEPQFFFVDQDGLANWKHIINEYFSNDHSLLIDLLDKFHSTQSIFANADEEARQRGRLLKRMSFVIFSGRVDEYHKEIPIMVEKIVECLKYSPKYDAVLHQVLICYRIMIYKFSAKRLLIIWPTIITQLIKIIDENQNPQVLLQLSKLIDYCTVILPEQFQPYKWIFVNHLDYTNEHLFRPLLKGEMTNIQEHKLTVPLETPPGGVQKMSEVSDFISKMMSRSRQDLHIQSNLIYDQAFVESEYMNDFISEKVLNYKREFD